MTATTADFHIPQASENPGGDVLYKLGLLFSTGRDAAMNLIEAHKWFNLAALKGSAEAKTYRRELADQMSSADVAAAQQAAREWLYAGA
jgi:TPR repeat protein